MNKLTIEEKAKRYDKALEWMRELYPMMAGVAKEDAEHFFPELKESEDERIRKWIKKELESKYVVDNIVNNVMADKAFAWLEKQGWQKPTDKVEHKFKVGDWVVVDGYTYQITDVYADGYANNEQGFFPKDREDEMRLWTIQDAKDGDLIYVGTEEKGIQAIFREYKSQTIFFHCYLCSGFVQGGDMLISDVEMVYPLQKTHYKRFFEIMHEAGYEWDAEKKKLKKIEQKPAWSEEDEKMYAAIIFILAGFMDNEDKIDWLKSLKDRVQPQTQNKWKDSLATADLENSLCDIQDSFSDTSYEYRILGEAIEFIRCTNPHWKPNEEQMKALSAINVTGSISYAEQGQELINLYNDLKKLKKE